jgi:hypothetical protein
MSFKLARPPVPEDAGDRAVRRLAAEKEKEKKDAEKAQACERMRAREALEKRRWRQARDGLPLEPSPETPDDDDDDDDDVDDEDDDMAARLGLSRDPRLGQGSPSQPPDGLAPSVLGAGTPRSRSEERRQAEGVLDPLAEMIGATPGGQAEPHAPQEQVPAPIVQEGRSLVRRDDAWAGRPLVTSGARGRSGAEAGSGATLGSTCGDRGPRGLSAGMIGLAPERVSI